MRRLLTTVCVTASLLLAGTQSSATVGVGTVSPAATLTSAETLAAADDLVRGRAVSPISEMDLTRDMVRPARGAPRWRGRRLTYASSLPASYTWSLRRAVQAWNRADVGIRLRPVPVDRARLRLVLVDRDTPVASVGRTRRAFVGLPRLDVRTWADREALGRVIAHELGHVLGLGHRPRASALMSARAGQSRLLAWGRYDCRWVRANEGRTLARRFGGRFQPAPRVCRFEREPRQLEDIAWTGGGDVPVTVTWRIPAGLDEDARVLVWAQDADACSVSTRFTRIVASVDPDAGRWTSDGPVTERCFQVQVVGSSGVPSPPTVESRPGTTDGPGQDGPVTPTPTPTPTPSPSPSPTPPPAPEPQPEPQPEPEPEPQPEPEPVVLPEAPFVDWLWYDRAFVAWIVQADLPPTETDGRLIWAKGPQGACPQTWPSRLAPTDRVLVGMGDDDDDSAFWLEAPIGSTDCVSFFTLAADGRISEPETYQLPDGGYDLD